MQQIQIIGRVGQDAVIRETATNKFTSFSVAVSDNYTDRQGAKVERTQWYDLTTDNTNLTKYLTKGTQVFVQGRLSVGTYTDTYGKVQPQCKVSARVIELLSSKKEETEKPATAQTTQATGPTYNSDDEANDLPF